MILRSAADGSLSIDNNAASSGLQLTFGADVTVTTCGTGAPTAGSKNSAGEITPTGAVACTVTFATPTFTNTPFCVVTVEGTTVTQYISAISTTSFTVSGLLSGEKFMYHCTGRI